MTSARKIAANRLNSRKSCGPRSKAGKAHASLNARRHGLSTIARGNPTFLPEIERMAKAICADDTNPPVLDQALIIAENALVLRCVQAERVAVVERLWDAKATALAKRCNYAALVKARMREFELAHDELEQIEPIVYSMMEPGRTMPLWEGGSGKNKGEYYEPVPERDEVDAMRAAMPDLVRLMRYERRAWSRQKRAIRRFMNAKLLKKLA
jgi:hypothetical protein